MIKEKIHLYEYNYDMPETSGIYLIKNTINSKGYVGQAEFLPSRAILSAHEHNEPLMRAYEKYGIENFTVVLLEECTIELLDEREIYWISELHTYVHDTESRGYNLTRGGRGIRGFTHSSETREKISLKVRGENHPNYGRKWSAEVRERMSEAAKSRPPMKEETKEKISIAMKRREISTSTREKHRLFMLEENNPARDSEVREKISLSMRSRVKGRPLSEKHKKSLSDNWRYRKLCSKVCRECGITFETPYPNSKVCSNCKGE